MCGRFTLTVADVAELARELSAELDRLRAGDYRPRYNVAPLDRHWVVRLEAGRRLLLPARFGFTSAGRPPLINARAETAARLPTFRRAFQEGRCLVPTDGFYEWTGPAGGRRPIWFWPSAGGLLLLAGLCREQGGELSFVILTTAASAEVAPVHDRMPAVLSVASAAAWLERADTSLLAPAPAGWLRSRAVSPRVNSVANDDPGLLEPPPPPRQGSLL
jgi:putative SOS response-associated peptidase YedK